LTLARRPGFFFLDVCVFAPVLGFTGLMFPVRTEPADPALRICTVLTFPARTFPDRGTPAWRTFLGRAVRVGLVFPVLTVPADP
jgi:hypothetical protein